MKPLYVMPCHALFFFVGMLWVFCHRQNLSFSNVHFVVEGGIKKIVLSYNDFTVVRDTLFLLFLFLS